MSTNEQVVAICRANDGARLCTEEIEMMDGYTKFSGCGHEKDHIWTMIVSIISWYLGGLLRKSVQLL
jgi:hypothetical protein